MTDAYRGTQSIQRALAVLKVFTDDRPAWNLTDLAEEVGLNKSTAFRILTALESENLVARDAQTDQYHLGLAVVTLGGRALRLHHLRQVAHSHLQALAAATGETAALEILQGNEVLIMDEVPGGYVMTGIQAIGTRWPAHATSTGKAMLAALSPEEVARRLPEKLATWTAHTIDSRSALAADLAATRERGYAVVAEELEVGLVAVGAPLRNFDGDVVGAISLAGPVSRISDERRDAYGRHVQATARDVSTWLGFPPERNYNLYDRSLRPPAASSPRADAGTEPRQKDEPGGDDR